MSKPKGAIGTESYSQEVGNMMMKAYEELDGTRQDKPKVTIKTTTTKNDTQNLVVGNIQNLQVEEALEMTKEDKSKIMKMIGMSEFTMTIMTPDCIIFEDSNSVFKITKKA